MARTAATDRTAPKRLKVRATKDGFYDNKMRRPGDVFFIDATQKYPEKYPADHPSRPGQPHPKAGKLALFSDKWMELAPADAPLKQSTNNDVIQRKHDETLGGQRIDGGEGGDEGEGGTGDEDPLGGDQ